jgi:uncharacterized protein YkwD
MGSAAHGRLRFRALTLTMVTAILGAVAAPIQSAAAPITEPAVVEVAPPRPMLYATDVQTYINAHRRRAGVAPVALQWQLNKAAVAHAYDMARRRLMTHVGSDGSNGGTRISRTGYRWWIWGEAVAAGQPTASAVVWAWLNSPAHRAILLDRRFKHMGLGRAVGSNGVPYWCLVMASPA